MSSCVRSWSIHTPQSIRLSVELVMGKARNHFIGLHLQATEIQDYLHGLTFFCGGGATAVYLNCSYNLFPS